MSQPQIIPKRKKKFTGGNASKRHRDRVNVEFNNLAQLLPFPENVIAKLDKSSILRLAVSYIRAKSFFKDTLALKNLTNTFGSKSKLTEHEKILTEEIFEGNGLVAEIFLQALDGFLIVVTEDMKVLYVSDSVRDYLGYCQAGIIHESLLQFVHTADHEIIRDGLTLGNEAMMIYESDSEKDGSGMTESGSDDINIKSEDSNNSSCDSTNRKMEFDGDKSVERRRFVCRMKCALSCSSRFYTAFRSFQFAGHVRKSKIKIGKEKKTVNTLIAFCTPTGSSGDDTIDFFSEGIEDMKGQDLEDVEELTEGLPKMTGLHIEPRLRPHVAPIPVTQNETERRSNCQAYSLLQNGAKDSYRRVTNQFKQNEFINGSVWSRMNGHAPYPDIFQAATHDYSPDSRRRSPTWSSKSPASSGRSTPESENGKAPKRPRSDKNGSPDFIQAKYAKLFDPSPYVRVVPKQVAFDDINRGANLLLELSNSRKQYIRPGAYPAGGRPLDGATCGSELAMLANRISGCIPSVLPGGYHDPRMREYSVIRSTRPESDASTSAPTSPKKDERKSFHISNILGLTDDKKSSKEDSDRESRTSEDARIHSPATSATRSPVRRERSPVTSCITKREALEPVWPYLNGSTVRSHFHLPEGLSHSRVWRNGDLPPENGKMECRNRGCPKPASDRENETVEVSSKKDSIKTDSPRIDNIDIKHSFAKILSGLTTTITSNLDRTIETVFQSSSESEAIDEHKEKKEARSISPECVAKSGIERKNAHRVIIKGMS